MSLVKKLVVSGVMFASLLSAATQVENFVERFYENVLERTADIDGLTYWSSELSSGSLSGEDLAKSFIFSQEFQNKNMTNDEFVKIMYRAFFGREADEGGYNQWKTMLDNGESKEDVLEGFLNSQEFTNLCNQYGITPSTTPTYTGVEEFVNRFYENILERTADDAGLTDWSSKLNSGSLSGEDLAKSFIFSQEFQNKNMTNDEFVKIMYRAFFGREADTAGYNQWKTMLDNGESKEDVLEGFLNSQEFTNLCQQYGITPKSEEEYSQEGNNDVSTHFTFGGEISYTVNELTHQGNILFGVSEDDGYDKIVFYSGGLIDTWFDCHNGQCIQKYDTTITINSYNDNSISVMMDDGTQGDLVINSAKSIITVNGNDTTSLNLKLIDLTYTATVSGSGNWDDVEPYTYYDPLTNSQQPITDIVTLKNKYIDPNEIYWFGDDESGNVYTFAQSNDTSITSGNVVKVVQDGYYSDGHTRYIRGSEVVGTWTLSNDVLIAETPTEIKKWRFNNGTFQDLAIEKPGSTYHMQWIVSSDASTLEQIVKDLYQ